MQKVTIYLKGQMTSAITKIEAKLVAHGTKPYAQHPEAPYVQFIPKGKRLPREVHEGYKPFVLILDGVGHPDPDGIFDPARTTTSSYPTGDVTIQRSRYLSADPRWMTDFNAMINTYLENSGAVVIGDYRYTKEATAAVAAA